MWQDISQLEGFPKFRSPLKGTASSVLLFSRAALRPRTRQRCNRETWLCSFSFPLSSLPSVEDKGTHWAMRLPLFLAFISVIPVAVQLLGKSVLRWGLCTPFVWSWCLETCAHQEEDWSTSFLQYLWFYQTTVKPASGLGLAASVGVKGEPGNAVTLQCQKLSRLKPALSSCGYLSGLVISIWFVQWLLVSWFSLL